jgi:hypothetical protein
MCLWCCWKDPTPSAQILVAKFHHFGAFGGKNGTKMVPLVLLERPYKISHLGTIDMCAKFWWQNFTILVKNILKKEISF